MADSGVPIRRRAFLFDDEEGVRNVLALLLKMRGYEVHAFPDPTTFCQDGRGVCPCRPGCFCGNLILSDLRMPKLDGLRFLKGQVEKGCRIPRMALISGCWTAATLKDARSLGCQIFHKPLRFHEFGEWLDECEQQDPPEGALVDSF